MLGNAQSTRYVFTMSTLAEIEAAVDQLPAVEQKALLQFIAERVQRSEALADDPVNAIIGAFSGGEPNDTGRRAEDILYGHEEAK